MADIGGAASGRSFQRLQNVTLLAGAREWWAQIIQVMPNLPRIRWTSSTPICPISIHLSEVTEETDNLTSVRAGFATVVIRERWGTAGPLRRLVGAVTMRWS